MYDLKDFFYDFSEAYKVDVDYFTDYDAYLRSNRLTVTLKRGANKIRAYYLSPNEGAIDLVHLKTRLEVLYNELVKKEEAANSD